MSLGINGVSNFNSIYCSKMIKNNENQKNENVETGSDVSNSQISAEKKIKQADVYGCEKCTNDGRAEKRYA